jgi:hypothetical protein
MDKGSVETALDDFRRAMEADGYTMVVDDLDSGSLRVTITAGPQACEDCLVPKPVMLTLLRQSLASLPAIREIDLVYPKEAHT